MPLSDIVNVQITRQTSAVSRAGFGTMLFLGLHKDTNNRVDFYSSQSAVEAVHGASSQIAIATSDYFAQSPSPTQVAIGRRTIDNVELTVTSAVVGTVYSVTINGTLFSYTAIGGDTAAAIATALCTAINAGAEPVTATAGAGGVFDLDADVAGVPYTVAVSSLISITAFVADDDIDDDLSACEQENNNWYGLTVHSRDQDDVELVADWTESRKKYFITASDDEDIIDETVGADTTSIAAYLRTNSLARSSCIYHALAATQFADCALFGQILPQDPGSYTAMFKTLASVTVDTLTDTQATNALAKNCNIFQEIGGVNILREGKDGEGEYIDVIIFVDWLQARMTERIYSLLVNSLKIPYTDTGAALVEAEIKAQLDQGIDRGGLAKDPAYTVTIPKVSTISSTDKANRLLPDITFSATLAGAIHKIEINGTVSL